MNQRTAIDLILERAGQAARSLGHDWVGAEHLLLALLSLPDATGQSLRASGLLEESVCGYIRSLPDRYHRPRFEHGGSGAHVIEQPTQIVLACAEGVAIGEGSNEMRSEHVLFALLWSEAAHIARKALERSGVTASRVLAELRELGIGVPSVSLPNHARWGSPYPVSSDDFNNLTQALRRAGTPYRYAPKGDHVLISIAEAPDARDRTD